MLATNTTKKKEGFTMKENTTAKNNNKTTTATTKKSIIDFVINGKEASEVLQEVNSRLEKVESEQFNIAMMVSYAVGVTIPAYTDNTGVEHGAATCENPTTQKDMKEKVCKNHATVSRWVTAMKLIIDAKKFNKFASGTLKFQYDKIIMLLDEKTSKHFASKDFDKNMKKSVSELKDIVKKANKSDNTSDNTSDETSDNVQEVDTITGIDFVEVTVDGTAYRVDKKAFLEWLDANKILD